MESLSFAVVCSATCGSLTFLSLVRHQHHQAFYLLIFPPRPLMGQRCCTAQESPPMSASDCNHRRAAFDLSLRSADESHTTSTPRSQLKRPALDVSRTTSRLGESSALLQSSLNVHAIIHEMSVRDDLRAQQQTAVLQQKFNRSRYARRCLSQSQSLVVSGRTNISADGNWDAANNSHHHHLNPLVQSKSAGSEGSNTFEDAHCSSDEVEEQQNAF